VGDLDVGSRNAAPNPDARAQPGRRAAVPRSGSPLHPYAVFVLYKPFTRFLLDYRLGSLRRLALLPGMKRSVAESGDLAHIWVSVYLISLKGGASDG
jgi:hypothetical protein